MSDSIDALNRDWHCANRPGIIQEARSDEWWADDLAQFLYLIDPRHVAARRERVRDRLLAPQTLSSCERHDSL